LGKRAHAHRSAEKERSVEGLYSNTPDKTAAPRKKGKKKVLEENGKNSFAFKNSVWLKKKSRAK